MHKLFPLLLTVLVLAIAVSCDPAGLLTLNPDSDDEGSKGAPSPSDDAFLKPGPTGDGAYILPNGRRISPAGTSLSMKFFPNDVEVSPDGSTAVAISFKHPTLTVLDTETVTIIQENELDFAFSGIAFNAAGDRFWIGGGGTQSVLEYAVSAGAATLVREIPVQGYPAGLALGPDGNTLFVCCNMSHRLAEIDLATGLENRFWLTGVYPYDVKLLPRRNKAFVSNWGSSSVTVINWLEDRVVKEIGVGHGPEEMAISPEDERLYVACSDTDSVDVIDTETDEFVESFNLHDPSEPTLGAMPNGMDISADGQTLYVTSAGYNCITVLDASSGEIEGRIPTGWYPTGIALDGQDERIYVTSGKGFGSAWTLPTGWSGAIQAIDAPSPGELSDYTEEVEDNIRWGVNFFADRDFESPVPTTLGQASEQIKHVIFVLKENKTYDQVFGDLEGTERDENFLVFGEEYTPNAHALAREFTTCDNFYVEGDTSILGHFWATAAICNDYMEKTFLAGSRYGLSTFEPAAVVPQGTLFDHLLDHGIEWRSYGQIVGMSHNFDRFGPYIDFKYGFWNMRVSDEVKVDEIIREIEAGIYPPLIYVVLPNDHNYGSSSGAPTPRYLVADNDAGLGKLVDYISHSDHWKDTAIFVTQDDPQSGSDHVDPHRTLSLVISPWAKRGHNSSVLYSMSSVWLTIEMILGIPSHTKFDKYTSPMYDCFTMDPDYSPYKKIPNPVPFERNEKGAPMQEYCDRQDWTVPDSVENLGEVLWAIMRPDEPFPHQMSVDPEMIEDEEEEAEEKREYIEALRIAHEWADRHGIEIGQARSW